MLLEVSEGNEGLDRMLVREWVMPQIADHNAVDDHSDEHAFVKCHPPFVTRLAVT